MTAEVIEGEVREVGPVRALVAQPGNQLVSRGDSPADMIAVASKLASALKDVVERQRLFTVIQGKKFPQVEAWMTIGRMDNVVAREAERPIRNEDGSYEAFVELIRLSDGMVIGRASALCGTPDDRPWATRAEPARRSMAVTRATSRAFRQQYSWIMALAGYEPTPAEEMPRDEAPADAPREVGGEREKAPDGGLVGTAEVGKSNDSDFNLRQTPTGMAMGFRLRSGKGGIKVIAHDPIASALELVKDDVIGQRVICYGAITDESFTAGKGTDKERTVNYQVLTLERIKGPDFTLPAENVPEAAIQTVEEAAATRPATPDGVSDGAVRPMPATNVVRKAPQARQNGPQRAETRPAPVGARLSVPHPAAGDPHDPAEPEWMGGSQ